jgi:hypothetical protein
MDASSAPFITHGLISARNAATIGRAVQNLIAAKVGHLRCAVPSRWAPVSRVRPCPVRSQPRQSRPPYPS